MPVWCTKRSFEPSSGVMKPKPFSSLNHLTVPVGIALPPMFGAGDRGGWETTRNDERWHEFRRAQWPDQYIPTVLGRMAPLSHLARQKRLRGRGGGLGLDGRGGSEA